MLDIILNGLSSVVLYVYFIFFFSIIPCHRAEQKFRDLYVEEKWKKF